MTRLIRVYILAALLFGAMLALLGDSLFASILIGTALTVLIYAGIGPFRSATELVKEFLLSE